MDTSRTEKLVQPILFHMQDTLGTIDMIAAVATASSLSLMMRETDEQSALDQTWFEHDMTKTVRRVSKTTAWDKLIEDADHLYDDCVFIDIPYSIYNSGAVAMPVMRYKDFPPIAKRAQVSGTNMPYRIGDIALPYEASATSRPHIFLRGELGMSAGKMAAQAAHAACLLTQDESIHPYDIAYLIASDDDIRVRRDDALIEVKDNGLTEIEPGTLTAIGCAHS